MRDEIVKYLSTVLESTGKTIAARIAQTQFDVAKELNRMHGDGLVEREKRKGGNEYIYWLTGGPRRPSSPAQLPASAPVPPAPAVVAEQPPADPVVVQELLAELEAERSTSARLRGEVQSLTLELNAERVISVSQSAEMSNLKQRVAELVSLSEANMAVDVTADLSEQLIAARSQVESAEQTIQLLRANNSALEQQIDNLTLGPVGSKGPVFFTVGRNCDSKRHTSIEKARKRANALVRSERESEVHVCTSVGCVVRGVEWVGK
ncbi:1-pyrroline-5-carboxylate dehydrogenase [Burkholderia glumae]|uniref:1-pyrroline-5-carboxylate dehydrogenase n=1 Tax=Burkholderia glumae TaxID=337 RepID=UPI0021500235|nr:1-pyrroline-5-carboxylate dehydrogenase [Burkholderia glumae]